MENWKPIVGLENYYEVSNLGNVRSLIRTGQTRLGLRKYGGKVLTPITLSTGYLGVNLTKKGYRKQYSVHFLVLTAFIGECPKGMEGCHNNGIRNDCRLENLRWDTRKNNHADKRTHGTWQEGEKVGTSKLTTEQALDVKYSKTSLNELAKKYNVSKGCVEKIRYGTSWKHI